MLDDEGSLLVDISASSCAIMFESGFAVGLLRIKPELIIRLSVELLLGLIFSVCKSSVVLEIPLQSSSVSGPMFSVVAGWLASGSNAILLNLLLRFVLGRNGEKFSFNESDSMPAVDLAFVLVLVAIPSSKFATDSKVSLIGLKYTSLLILSLVLELSIDRLVSDGVLTGAFCVLLW